MIVQKKSTRISFSQVYAYRLVRFYRFISRMMNHKVIYFDREKKEKKKTEKRKNKDMSIKKKPSSSSKFES